MTESLPLVLFSLFGFGITFPFLVVLSALIFFVIGGLRHQWSKSYWEKDFLLYVVNGVNPPVGVMLIAASVNPDLLRAFSENSSPYLLISGFIFVSSPIGFLMNKGKRLR
jgi:hypothetical protein